MQAGVTAYPEDGARLEGLFEKMDASLDEAAVIAWARNNMANYKVPRSVCFLDEFPMNAGGKVLKNELRDLDAGKSR